METMRKVLQNTALGKDFYLLLGDFLDAFYRAENSERQAMIKEIPCETGLQCPQEILAFAAATAHKLANEYKLDVPRWVFDKRFYSVKPHFGCGAKGNLRLLFMYKSPAEFKHRNLFVDENVLVRV
ncbi:MAG: hypothetical protein FWB93_01300 [Oscillospiraceae bacterium]|nr:hypothetical protein [Oscillospiraceae bacterium]